MYEKYVTALRLMDQTILARTDPKVEGETRHPVTVKWDELFTFIYANFEKPVSAKGCWNNPAFKEEYDLCRPFIDGTFRAPSEELESRIRRIPPVILDVVWPIAIARFLARDCGLPFNHRESRTFTEFHYRYGNMVVSC